MKVIITEMNSKRVIERRTPYNDKRINTRREYHTLKIYAPNIGASKYVNQILTDIKGEINKNNSRRL